MRFPFSSASLGVLVESIAGYTHSGIGTLLLKAGADHWDPQGAEPGERLNKEKRLQLTFKRMRESGSEEAAKAALAVARIALSDAAAAAHTIVWYEALRRALAADGWEFDEESEQLVPTTPGVVFADETSSVEAALRGRGWTTAAAHYSQARRAFGNGDWESANGQLRNLLEELLPAVAEAETGTRPREVVAALQVLRSTLFLKGEFDIVRGLWAMSQERGPHSGLSDEEEARFRLISITAYVRFLLGRVPT